MSFNAILDVFGELEVWNIIFLINLVYQKMLLIILYKTNRIGKVKDLPYPT